MFVYLTWLSLIHELHLSSSDRSSRSKIIYLLTEWYIHIQFRDLLSRYKWLLQNSAPKPDLQMATRYPRAFAGLLQKFKVSEPQTMLEFSMARDSRVFFSWKQHKTTGTESSVQVFASIRIFDAQVSKFHRITINTLPFYIKVSFLT